MEQPFLGEEWVIWLDQPGGHWGAIGNVYSRGQGCSDHHVLCITLCKLDTSRA